MMRFAGNNRLGTAVAVIAQRVIIANLGAELPLGSHFQIDDKTPAEIALRRQHKNFFHHGWLLQIQHDAHTVNTGSAQAGLGDKAVRFNDLFYLGINADILGVYHQAARLGKQKDFVIELESASKTTRMLPMPCPMRREEISAAAAGENAERQSAIPTKTGSSFDFKTYKICGINDNISPFYPLDYSCDYTKDLLPIP